MPLQMSVPHLYLSDHPHFSWLPLPYLSSCSLEVTFTRRLLGYPDWFCFLCSQGRHVASGTTSITVVDPCLDPGSRGLVLVLH